MGYPLKKILATLPPGPRPPHFHRRGGAPEKYTPTYLQERRRRGVGGGDPRTFENREDRPPPPRFENEVAKMRCFSDF